MFGRLARGVKDGALGMAIKAYLNDRLSEFGEVSECSVDTKKSRIEICAMLKGERDLLNVAVEHYELNWEDDRVYATLKSFSSSRPWVTLLLEKLFAEKRYKLPTAVGAML